ncbi:MAG TPA: hypothetical protein VGX23_02820 [Actinocrinis sp.]|nr:hypothetical protein [Actinocrinis sp.]
MTAKPAADPIVLRAATWDGADHLLRLATLASPEIAGTSGSCPVPGHRFLYIEIEKLARTMRTFRAKQIEELDLQEAATKADPA